MRANAVSLTANYKKEKINTHISVYQGKKARIVASKQKREEKKIISYGQNYWNHDETVVKK